MDLYIHACMQSDSDIIDITDEVTSKSASKAPKLAPNNGGSSAYKDVHEDVVVVNEPISGQKSSATGSKSAATAGQRSGATGSNSAATTSQSAAATGSKLAATAGQTSEVAPGNKKSFKIMSYNVWFQESVEVVKRMEAIGKLIEAENPDYVMLQEVDLACMYVCMYVCMCLST